MDGESTGQRTCDKDLMPSPHQVGDVALAPLIQAAPPQRTVSIPEGGVDLRRHPSPVSGPAGHRAVHSAGAEVETPVVSTSKEVDLVLLGAPGQGGLDGGPQQAQLREGCRAQDWLLAVVHPVLSTCQRREAATELPDCCARPLWTIWPPPLPRTSPASVSLSVKHSGPVILLGTLLPRGNLEPVGISWGDACLGR